MENKLVDNKMTQRQNMQPVLSCRYFMYECQHILSNGWSYSCAFLNIIGISPWPGARCSHCQRLTDGLEILDVYIINTVLEAGIHTSQVSVGFAKYSFRLLYICNGPYISTDFRWQHTSPARFSEVPFLQLLHRLQW